MLRQALVIEDDPGMRAIYRRVLADIEYEVIEAVDGVAAIDMLKQVKPDIIFLDVLLPHANGLTVLDYLSREAHLQDTHVVIVTSNRHFEHEAQQIRRVDFVQKPIRPAQIRELANTAAQM
ncbi:MAG: response regulator [bacterium]|nr:response regulator [bacterium]